MVGLTYSISPVHTHEYYVERAARRGGVGRHRPALPEGPGRAADPGRRARAGPAFIAAVAPRPVELHSHCTIGLGPLAYVEGLRAGIRTLHTAVAPVASGTSNPPAETTLRNLEAEGLSHGLDLEALAAVSDHFRALARDRGLPLGVPAEYDAAYYRHQMPGGMVTTTRRMLARGRAARSCSTPCSRRSRACARRWATRSWSRRSPSSWPRRRR